MALPGQGGTAGNGLKGAPAIKDFKAGATETLLETPGPGCVRHIWLTSHDRSPAALRSLVLRMYWEGSETSSVEVPLGDFFGVAHGAAVPMECEYVLMQEGRNLFAVLYMAGSMLFGLLGVLLGLLLARGAALISCKNNKNMI
ncbi:MAG: DUF2961 domain-containing protein [Chloroflexaceae bacterium]|nr:DUF2961 domain-containing protein [Chloroflexaceae bacterium]